MQWFIKEDVHALENLKRQSWGVIAQARELYRTIAFPKCKEGGTGKPRAIWCFPGGYTTKVFRKDLVSGRHVHRPACGMAPKQN